MGMGKKGTIGLAPVTPCALCPLGHDAPSRDRGAEKPESISGLQGPLRRPGDSGGNWWVQPLARRQTVCWAQVQAEDSALSSRRGQMRPCGASHVIQVWRPPRPVWPCHKTDGLAGSPGSCVRSISCYRKKNLRCEIAEDPGTSCGPSWPELLMYPGQH